MGGMNRKDSGDSGKLPVSGSLGGQKRHRDYRWLLGLLAGAVFLALGAAQGELAVIWKKAVMICMECIGIG